MPRVGRRTLVAEVVASLGIAEQELGTTLVNGRPVDGDVLTLLPLIGGG